MRRLKVSLVKSVPTRDTFRRSRSTPPEPKWRFCTEEEMQRMPAIFGSLGICDAAGNLLVSPEPD